MLPWRLQKAFMTGISMRWHVFSTMEHSRARLWIVLAAAYAIVMAFIYLMNIPLRSQTLHNHYDLSGERVLDTDRLVAKKVAEKYLKLSISGEQTTNPEATKILTDVFNKADGNKDGKLDITELSNWVAKKVREHINLSLKENVFIFTAVDQNPRNGEVSWDEYVQYFLKMHDYDQKFIKEHTKSMQGLPRELKEALMRDKAAYSEAARDDPSRLTLDEFLAFRHPESSHASILNIVEETLSRLDMDEDSLLTLDEFSDPLTNEVPDYLTEDQFREERKREFRTIIDKDKNGFVDRMELLRYVDPRNFHHAEKEAYGLISMGDINEDGVLTLPEVLMEKDAFMRSKMVDAAKSFHDEF